MNRQAARVEEALNIVHSKTYQKPHDRVLEMEEQREGATITINATELEMLKSMVTERIGREHETWYDITHDEVITTNDMAYELAGSVLREDRLHRLLKKLG